MSEENLEIQKSIHVIVIKLSKKYRGKGPLFVNIEVKDNIVNIFIKGVLFSIGEILLKQGDTRLLGIIWRKIENSYKQDFLHEFYQLTEKQCDLISMTVDVKSDSANIMLKIAG